MIPEHLYDRPPFPMTADGVALDLDKSHRLYQLGGEYVHEMIERPYYDNAWLIKLADDSTIRVDHLYFSKSSAWRALAMRHYGELESLISNIKMALMKAVEAERKDA